MNHFVSIPGTSIEEASLTTLHHGDKSYIYFIDWKFKPSGMVWYNKAIVVVWLN